MMVDQERMMWEEHEASDVDLLQKQAEDEVCAKDACPLCGCTEPYIEGDDVYFGYTGWPVCPRCKGV